MMEDAAIRHTVQTMGPAARSVEPAVPAQTVHQLAPTGPAPVEQQALERAVAKMREAASHVEPRLQIDIDPDLNRAVVKIMDGKSGEVIRQIPGEEVIKIAKHLSSAQGLLFTQHT